MSDYVSELRASVERLGAWHDLPFFTNGAFEKVLGHLSASDRKVSDKITTISAKITSVSAKDLEVLPPPDLVFAALEAVQPQDVRVVILGQDPYPTPGHAHGLAFSVEPDVTPIPRSLSNIFKELSDDLNVDLPNGNLRHWAQRGVLMLNSALTVEAGNAGSHAKIGWSVLTKEVIALLSDLNAISWVLWGCHAQAFRPDIDSGTGTGHQILESAHPSPLSARRGFFGSKPFSQINEHMIKQGLTPIDWMP
ncbi:UNVERIFIED_CONTAM: hypothetical protein GTU68_010272 [Idotea baltica]|nr:hypothetical protein [Idotea baltica]